jgi:hypothetical protein
MTNQLSINPSNNQPANTVETKLAEFLQKHGEVEMIIPVALGVFITSRFQLRGANALLANLLIAGISRQIFQHLKEADGESTEKITEAEIKTMTSPSVMEIAEGYAIVHSVPGRIRLRIQRLAEDVLFVKRLERLLKDDSHVIKVRVNRTAASLVIHYEKDGSSEMDLGLRLLNIINQAESEDFSVTT